MSDVVRAAYDARAAEYVRLLGSVDQLAVTDRLLIERWADAVNGPVLDAGCGPGHWTAHLRARGVDVSGIDLSSAFVTHAARTHRGVDVRVGDLTTPDVADGALGGVLAWFSLIHLDDASLHGALTAFARCLRPSGSLLVGFFTAETHDEFDHAVVRAHRRPVAEVRSLLADAGFRVRETHLRAAPGARPVGAVWAALG